MSIDQALHRSLANNFRLGLSYVCHRVGEINSRGIWHGDNPLDYSVPSIMIQLSLIFVFTRFIYVALKPLGQPLIISQILGGVVIGPSVLGQNTTFSTRVFPKKSINTIDTLSVFGLTMFIFLLGVKVDPSMIWRSGKKAVAIGILGFFISYALATCVSLLLRHFLSLGDEFSSVFPYLIAVQSLNSFPVIACFLDELKILNSDIGQLASSSSIICDMCHWAILAVKYATQLALKSSFKLSVGSLLSLVLYIVFIVFCIRPAALWIIRHTPEGRPVKEVYIVAVFVAVMCCGFIGEIIGMSSVVAGLFIGLMIPDGPPLGAALVERLECFVSVLFMPLFFTMCGLHMDVFAIENLTNLGATQLVVLFAFIGKVVGTMLPPLFWRMPFRDALSLALIMNSKGLVELAMLNEWKRKKLINEEHYAIMTIAVVLVTGVISPIVKIIYDPSKRYVAYKRRTILHLRQNEELRVLACVHSQENVGPIMTLLQVSGPSTRHGSINLVVLHLIKLTGRASSLLIAYREREKPSVNPNSSERIFNAFKKLEQQSQNHLMVHCYKGVSPYATMHNDVCSLALEKRSILIIVPFHKQWTFGEAVESTYAFRHLNKNVLDMAPCSVGILIDRANRKSRYVITDPSSYRVAVLFFGGADDREALAYARRMSQHSNVTVTLTRFVSSASTPIVLGTERSKLLDDNILRDFRMDCTLWGDRVWYREEVVGDGMEVMAVTKSVLENAYDLILVGRRHRQSPIMFQLTKWNRRGELGEIGEMLASSDFECGTSTLVMQQQTKLWGLQDPEESTHLRKIDVG